MDSYVETKYFEWFLSEIDPYKATDLFGRWFLSFRREETVVQCIRLLNSMKKWDLNKILKHG